MAKVELKHIGKVYDGNVRAVTDQNITVNDGEFCVFVGPSGCGKSTTLRMVAGLEDISEGELYIDGELMNDVPPKDRNIAMVFQNYALYPHMTVYDNMAFGLKIRKTPKDEIERRVREAAKILDIEQYLNRKPKALSGGQRQRVAVGRAIVRQPKVFLFDEPLSNLDAKLRVQMRSEISSLHHRLGSTMIYVTHDQVEAMTMGSKIVVMKDGVIQQIGSPLYVYHHPANKFVAGFIGSPPMNFMTLNIRDEAGKLAAWEDSFKIEPTPEQATRLTRYAGENVACGVRPEDLSYVPAGGSIQAKITMVEPLGAETNLYLSTGKHEFTARTTVAVPFEIGQTAGFDIDLQKVKFFDLDTGANICEDIKREW